MTTAEILEQIFMTSDLQRQRVSVCRFYLVKNVQMRALQALLCNVQVMPMRNDTHSYNQYIIPPSMAGDGAKPSCNQEHGSDGSASLSHPAHFGPSCPRYISISQISSHTFAGSNVIRKCCCAEPPIIPTSLA